MKPSHEPWLRLVRLAREAPPAEPADLPAAFATRVAARGLALRTGAEDVRGWLAWRALGAALAVTLLCAGANYRLFAGGWLIDDHSEDPVGELIAEL
jgi:hypothetical protein